MGMYLVSIQSIASTLGEKQRRSNPTKPVVAAVPSFHLPTNLLYEWKNRPRFRWSWQVPEAASASTLDQ
jgi:hypothetical protein